MAYSLRARARSALNLSVAALLTLVAVVGGRSMAEAYVLHGCEYAAGSIDPISYRFYSITGTIKTAFNEGQANWDAAAVPGYFDQQDWSLDPEVPVHDGVYGGGWYGLTSWGCSSGHYTGNEVYMKFDTTEMGTLAAWQRRNIAIHELGHAYGLADVTGTLCRVMNVGKALEGCAVFPASDDISGVNAIY